MRPVASPTDVPAVRDLLRDTIGGNWGVALFDDGSTSRSYVGSHGPRRVFIKLDVRTDALERLATLGVAPPVIRAGVMDGRGYVIQEWIDGTRPERAWFARELDAWAELLCVYQRDAPLAGLLSDAELTPDAYADDLARRADRVTLSGAEQAASRVRAGAEELARVPPGPTHGDPNSSNFLVHGERVYLVDWDDAALSDPMRDIGQLLWWYVPEEQWPRYFERAAEPFDAAALQRLYWWVAAESLDVALRLAAEGRDRPARDFLTDALAALDHRPNARPG